MNDVKVVYTEECDNLKNVRKREKYLKTATGRGFLKSKIRS